MKETKDIILFDTSGFDSLPDSLENYIKLLQELLEKIPSEFRHTAKIVHISEDSYDDWDVTTVIQYERPETEEEYQQRIAQIAGISKTIEEQEREQLKRLKAKYEQT